MNTEENQISYIYESPDGGITLYRRPFGKDEPREVFDKSMDKWILS
jgi:hypothetical protein